MTDYINGADYSKDYYRWLTKPNDTSSSLTLDFLQQEIIKNHDAAFAFFFAAEFEYKPHLMQKVIIDAQNAQYAYAFAQNIKNADIKALQNIVINSNNIKYITYFACRIPNSNLNKLKHIIIKSGKPRYLFELAQILTSRSDLNKIQELIIQSKSFTYMRLFANKIKMADVNKIEQAVLASDNGKEIKKFAAQVKQSKMKKFLLMV